MRHRKLDAPYQLGKSQNWLMVAHQLASAYEKSRSMAGSGGSKINWLRARRPNGKSKYWRKEGLERNMLDRDQCSLTQPGAAKPQPHDVRAGRVRRACDDAPLSLPVRLCDAPDLLHA